MTQDTSNRKSVRFADHVPPGETRTYTAAVQEDATVEQLDVRIYTGPRLDLRVTPFVAVGGGEDGGRSDRVPLVDLVGKDFIDGDGDRFTFYPTESVKEDRDAVGVEVTNKSAEHGYDFAADVTLDREGGSSRGFLSVLRGVV